VKKILSLLLCAILLVGITAACASPGTSGGGAAPAASNEPIELTYWTLAGWRPNHWEYVTEQYALIDPNVSVDVVVNSTDDHKRNKMIAAASNTMPSFWFNWGGSLGSFYPENGLTWDLTEYAKEHNWDGWISPLSLEMATLGGMLSGKPHNITAFGVFYHKGLFERAGITAEPTTYAEFEAAMAALHNADIIPLAAGGRNGWQVFRLIELLMEKNMGAEKHDRLLAQDTEMWLEPGLTQSFQEFRRYVEYGYYPEGFITADPNDSRSLLYNEVAAMMIDGSSMEVNARNDGQNPEDFGWFALPLSAAGNRMTSFVQMNQFSSRLTNAEFEAAMAIDTFAFSPEVVDHLGIVQQPIPRNDIILRNMPITEKVVAAFNERGGFLITDQGLPQEVVNRLFEIQDEVALGQTAPEAVGRIMKEFHDNWIAMNP